MKKKIIISIIIVILIFFIFCLKSFVVISIKDTNISKNQWLIDISYLQNKLPEVHKNLYFKTAPKDFNVQIDELKKNIDKLNSEEITIQLMKIVASIGDAHTTIMNYKSNNIFPFTIYKFKDGYYLTEVDDKYKNLLGSKILAVNNIPIDDIINKVSVLIPHENENMVISKAPDYLQDPKVINYLTNTKGSLLHLTVLDFNAKSAEINIETKSSTLKMSSLSDNIINKPIYMKNNSNFWYEYLEGPRTLYCQFNLCLINTPSTNDLSSINDIVKKNTVEKVIFDLRNNQGGFHSNNNALINYVKNNSQMNLRNKLFVIIGRDTFSSGLMYALDFKQQTNAILCGEGTSGKPSGYGDIKNFNLPNSKLNITYSTKYFETDGFNSDALKPDVEIDTDINSYANGIDPVVESIINNQK